MSGAAFKKAVYRKIAVRIWADQKFRNLSPIPPSGQALWLYLLTGPHTGAIPGLFSSGKAAMAEGLNWSLEDFERCFSEIEAQGMALADWKARLVWVPNAIRYNRPDNPNILKFWGAWMQGLPECDLLDLAREHLRDFVSRLGPNFAAAFNQAAGAPGRARPEKTKASAARSKTSDKTTTYQNPLGNSSVNGSPNGSTNAFNNGSVNGSRNPSGKGIETVPAGFQGGFDEIADGHGPEVGAPPESGTKTAQKTLKNDSKGPDLAAQELGADETSTTYVNPLLNGLMNGFANPFTNGSGNGMANQEQEQQQQQQQEKERCANAHSSLSPLAGAANDPAEPPAINAIDGAEIAGERSAPVPYAEILAAYHAACPSLPRVTLLNPGRKAAMRSRWAEARRAGLFPAGDGERNAGLAWFAGFFARVEASDFLAGRSRDWRASLDWLLSPKNFGKVVDGAYDNRSPAPPGRRYPHKPVAPQRSPGDYAKPPVVGSAVNRTPSGHFLLRAGDAAPVEGSTQPATHRAHQDAGAKDAQEPSESGAGDVFLKR